jgi:prevent-host-death family protein
VARTWQLQQAKNRLSEVVQQAIEQGPQIITRNGVETAVVLSFDEFKKLRRPEGSLADFLAESPLRGAKLDLERRRDLPREVDL